MGLGLFVVLERKRADLELLIVTLHFIVMVLALIGFSCASVERTPALALTPIYRIIPSWIA